MKVNSSRMNFAEIVQEYITDYRQDVLSTMYETIDEVSKETVKDLKDISKKTFKSKKKKAYWKGWTRKVEQGRTSVGATIYGKSGTYQLAHLLEYGHAKAGGGRVEGTPHISVVNDKANDEVYHRMMDKLERLP